MTQAIASEPRLTIIPAPAGIQPMYEVLWRPRVAPSRASGRHPQPAAAIPQSRLPRSRRAQRSNPVAVAATPMTPRPLTASNKNIYPKYRLGKTAVSIQSI